MVALFDDDEHKKAPYNHAQNDVRLVEQESPQFRKPDFTFSYERYNLAAFGDQAFNNGS